jgi:salicylate hydroxylase
MNAQVSEDSRLRIVVVGAGLGGIAAAISCGLAGHVVDVLEQAKELAEVRSLDLRPSSIDIHPV